MMTLEVENIKCGGCANQIESKLRSKYNPEFLLVDVEAGTIDIQGNNLENKEEELYQFLKKMGYAKLGEATGIDNAKSYVSCMIGRVKA